MTSGPLRVDVAAFDFLDHLVANNDRAWFEPRRDEFRRLLVEPLAAVLESASGRLSAGPWPVSGGRGTIFRQLRDQRYAMATPYATAVRALLTSTGTKPAREGCVHVEIDASGGFVGVGFHRPPAALLAPIRRRMLTEPATWRAIVHDLRTSGHELADDRLVRMPRGFEQHADDLLADDVRLRSLDFAVPLAPDEWTSGVVVDRLVETVRAGMPLLRFGNDACGFPPHPGADANPFSSP